VKAQAILVRGNGLDSIQVESPLGVESRGSQEDFRVESLHCRQDHGNLQALVVRGRLGLEASAQLFDGPHQKLHLGTRDQLQQEDQVTGRLAYAGRDQSLWSALPQAQDELAEIVGRRSHHLRAQVQFDQVPGQGVTAVGGEYLAGAHAEHGLWLWLDLQGRLGGVRGTGFDGDGCSRLGRAGLLRPLALVLGRGVLSGRVFLACVLPSRVPGCGFLGGRVRGG